MLALSKIGELGTMTLDTSEILKQVVTITAEIMKVDCCSIYLYYPVEEMLVLAATVGLKPDAVGHVRIKPGEGITGRAAKQGRTVAVRDVTNDKRNIYIPIIGEEDFHSLLSVPLKSHNENIGVMNVQTKKPRTFQKRERSLLKTIAHLVSGLIRNARLYESVLVGKKELEEAHERLIESEKMAALGRLAATLSHELRNPLAGLKGASQLLLRKTKDGDERKQYISLIIEEIDRLSTILDDLLHFAKPRALRYDVFDANQVIEDSLVLLSEDLTQKGIIVRKRLSVLPHIMADRDRLKQVVVNILLNSMDATPADGEIIISSSVTISDGEDREMVAFQFKDSGQGISNDVLMHIFEPFYTTKPNGVGLGLVVCKTIIEQHRGTISIHSNTQNGVFNGTLVTIKIPIMNEKKILNA